MKAKLKNKSNPLGSHNMLKICLAYLSLREKLPFMSVNKAFRKAIIDSTQDINSDLCLKSLNSANKTKLFFRVIDNFNFRNIHFCNSKYDSFVLSNILSKDYPIKSLSVDITNPDGIMNLNQHFVWDQLEEIVANSSETLKNFKLSFDSQKNSSHTQYCKQLVSQVCQKGKNIEYFSLNKIQRSDYNIYKPFFRSCGTGVDWTTLKNQVENFSLSNIKDMENLRFLNLNNVIAPNLINFDQFPEVCRFLLGLAVKYSNTNEDESLGMINSSFDAAFKGNKSLCKLSFSDLFVGSNALETITTFYSLKELTLSNCKLNTHELNTYIPNIIRSLPTMKLLDLSYNKFEKIPHTTVFQFIDTVIESSLVYLLMIECSISETSIEEGLEENYLDTESERYKTQEVNKSLLELNLSRNPELYKSQFLSTLFIPKLRKLKKLRLSGITPANHNVKFSFLSFLTSFTKLPHDIYSVDLSQNNFEMSDQHSKLCFFNLVSKSSLLSSLNLDKSTQLQDEVIDLIYKTSSSGRVFKPKFEINAEIYFNREILCKKFLYMTQKSIGYSVDFRISNGKIGNDEKVSVQDFLEQVAELHSVLCD